MSLESILASLDGAALLRAAAFALLGGIGGALYFASVWRSAKALAAGARLTKQFAPILLRFILMGLLLGLAARQGAGPLLATAAGVLMGRVAVLRRAREASS
ncbi:ATP synthase subunit I [Rhodoblastus sp.]|uniref:N-ATPase subunit AtpR n=1 Tax=Rhodoblastus sp. TaxID=1962975 RepID=UPI0025D28009|nr:ATP synthase subunit I [Rhodoblastus sp.]